MGCYGLDSSSSRYGPAEGSCEHGNEPSDSIKCWDILEWQLADSQEDLSSMKFAI
jgi:hypothetical protein